MTINKECNWAKTKCLICPLVISLLATPVYANNYAALTRSFGPGFTSLRIGNEPNLFLILPGFFLYGFKWSFL